MEPLGVPRAQANLGQAPIKKPPSRMEAFLKSVFGQTSSVFQGWRARNMVAQMKRDGLYDLAVDYLGLKDARTLKAIGLDEMEHVIQELLIPLKKNQLGMEEIKSELEKFEKDLDHENTILKPVIAKIDEEIKNIDTINTRSLIGSAIGVKGIALYQYVNGFFQGDKEICDDMKRILESKAKALGYSASANVSGLRKLSVINDLWQGSVDDKLQALRLIVDQMSAHDIQVSALRKLFSKVPEQDLNTAVAKHYEIYDRNRLLEIRVPIGSSGLTKVFFQNEKGQIEVALAHIDIKKEGPAGAFKRYNFAGTLSAVKDIACLDLHLDAVKKNVSLEIHRREMEFWKEQKGVKHIPALYSYTDRNIFCENFTGGDLFDFVSDTSTTPQMREDVFRRAGIVLFEYLMDIGKLGLVHRDLKPDNLLLSKDRKEIVVTDFGLMARTTEQREGAGTPGYAAPEVYTRGAAIDTRSDIYSAAMTLAAIRYDVDVRQANGSLQTIKSMAGKPDYDDFDRILSAMLSTNPDKRPTLDEALTRWNQLYKQAEAQGT